MLSPPPYIYTSLQTARSVYGGWDFFTLSLHMNARRDSITSAFQLSHSHDDPKLLTGNISHAFLVVAVVIVDDVSSFCLFVQLQAQRAGKKDRPNTTTT